MRPYFLLFFSQVGGRWLTKKMMPCFLNPTHKVSFKLVVHICVLCLCLNSIHIFVCKHAQKYTQVGLEILSLYATAIDLKTCTCSFNSGIT